MNEKEQLSDEMVIYEMAYLRGRDAHQKRVLKFIGEHFGACSSSHDSHEQHLICVTCQGAKAWHDAIKLQLDRKPNES